MTRRRLLAHCHRLDPAFRAAWLALRPWNRHSLVLVLFGGLYLAQGLNWALNPVTDTRRAQLTVLLRVTDGSVTPWSLLWVVVGTSAALSARWPPDYPRWGYVALGMLPGFWASISVWGWVAYDTPRGIAIAGALSNAVAVAAIWAISGLTAPIPAPPEPAPEGLPPGRG